MSSSSLSSSLFSTSTRVSNCKEWKPKTPAGRIVKRGEVTSLQEFRRLKLELKEPEIVDKLFPNLREEVLKVTNIGHGQYQRKAYVVVSDGQGLIGLGRKCAGDDLEAINGAKRNARLSVFQLEITPPVKTVQRKVTGEFSGVEVTIEPFYKVILASPMIARILKLAGYDAALQTGNCNKATGPVIEAVFDALRKLKVT